MKNKFCAIVLMLFTTTLFSQITVSEADIIDVGDIFYQAHDTLPSSSVSLGNAGANQTWDFSLLQVHDYDTIEILDPFITPFISFYPTANLCIENDGGYMYIEKGGNETVILGVDDIVLDPSLLYVPLPLSASTAGSTIPITIDSTIFDPFILSLIISDTLAPYISYPLVTDKIDSLRVIVTENSVYEVDAWGQITIQLGTFDCLRLKTERNIISTFMAYCSDTSSLSGAWYNLPTALVPPSTLVLFNIVLTDLGFDPEVVVTYQWWTNDPLIKFALVQIDVDSLGEIDAIDFMHSPSPSSVANLLTNNFNIYPIPVSNNLNIEAQNKELTSLELVDLNGKVILKKEFTQSTSLLVSDIAKGMYFLNLKTVEGELTKQIIIE